MASVALERGVSGAETDAASLGRRVRKGLVWSTANQLVLRLATLVLGIVLARLLVPADFGVFAIGLLVQSILTNLTDLGLSADLVRRDDPETREPTVATLSTATGVILAAIMTASAVPVAKAMHEPQASGVIMVLSWTLVLSGAGVVPYAHLLRTFQQPKLFMCTAGDFVTYTIITIGLVLLGMGPMALAVGRVCAQTVSTSLQFILARMRPRFGFDRAIAKTALAFGLPIAAANVLSWALLNVDNVVIAHVLGALPLGFYVLAFNISSWPMSTIGQAVRSVSLAGFSQTAKEEQDAALTRAMSLTWLIALPLGILLAALAKPLIVLLYGGRWSASSAALGALGIFGALIVVFDLCASYLTARGAARSVLVVQIVWFLGLIPPMVLATQWLGIRGAAWAHVFIGALVILPAYLLALRGVGARIGVIVRAMWLPTLAAAPMWWAGHAVATAVGTPILALLAGGTTGVLTYLVICHRMVLALWPRSGAAPDDPARIELTELIDEVPLAGHVDQPALTVAT
jgi:lipopolysaccharide exporter